MAIETLPFDAADHLESRAAQAELLTDAFASGEPAYVAAALRTVARARARGGEAPPVGGAPAGSAGDGLGDPTLSSVLDMMRSFGMRLQVEPERA